MTWTLLLAPLVLVLYLLGFLRLAFLIVVIAALVMWIQILVRSRR